MKKEGSVRKEGRRKKNGNEEEKRKVVEVWRREEGKKGGMEKGIREEVTSGEWRRDEG